MSERNLKEIIDQQLKGLSNFLEEDSKLTVREKKTYLNLCAKNKTSNTNYKDLLRLEHKILSFCNILIKRRVA